MITGYEYTTVKTQFVTVDLLIWRRYRVRAPGIVEACLDRNPHLSRLHRKSPFLPIGTQVRIPIDLGILRGAPQPKNRIELYNTVAADVAAEAAARWSD